MTDLQLYLAIGLPVGANGAMFLLFQANIHKLLDAFRAEIDTRLESLRHNMDARFELQTQALLRVEQVMDVRLRVLSIEPDDGAPMKRTAFADDQANREDQRLAAIDHQTDAMGVRR
jgi:hypothetical protein